MEGEREKHRRVRQMHLLVASCMQLSRGLAPTPAGALNGNHTGDLSLCRDDA